MMFYRYHLVISELFLLNPHACWHQLIVDIVTYLDGFIIII